MLLRVRMATERGSRALRDGTVERLITDFAAKHNPEAAYFFPDEGRRCAAFVFDMTDSSQIPEIAEPFFQEVDAEVQLIPAMNLDDLQKAIRAFGQQ